MEVEFQKFKNMYYRLDHYSEPMVFVWRHKPGCLKTENHLGGQTVIVSSIPSNTFICFGLSAFSWETLKFANFLLPVSK